MREERWTDAAPLLRQAIELEPEAYDALNNLGVVLGKIGDAAAGRVLMAQALAIKPTYVFARVNLALGMIDGDVDGADALLAPLAALDVFSAQEFAFYQFGLAHVAVKREEFDQARNLLQMAISILPGYAPAVRLLATVEQLEQQSGDRELWESIRASSDQRSQRERSRQQARLTTLTPPVAEVVASYTAELLRPIARALRPTQGITGLRKAELQQLVTQTLLDPVAVAAIVGRALNDQERAALRAVLDAGGAMPRERFFDAYGDDRSELPWWNYKLPASVGGRLRLHLLLAEATVDGVVYTVAPVELREPVAAALGG
jgi:tetratricopeptide (TPR) repeat protein